MHNYVKYGLKKSVYVAKSESHLNKVVFSLNRSKVPYSHYIQKVSTIHTCFICILLKKEKTIFDMQKFKKIPKFGSKVPKKYQAEIIFLEK